MRIELRPAFDEAVRGAELPVRKAAAKTLRLLHALEQEQLWSYSGLNFEKLHGFVEPTTGYQLYSLRITRSVRAVAALADGPTLLLISLHAQHDEAYRPRR